MLAIAVLAAGKGSRMNSTLPKVLHSLAGKTLIKRVLSSYQHLKPEKEFIIVGHQAKKIQQSLNSHQSIKFIFQQPQNGTGHAVQQLIPQLTNFKGELIVLNGDVPLLTGLSLENLLSQHRKTGAGVTFLSARLSSPTGYGRVVTDSTGRVDKIIEESDCNDIERKNNLTNAGVYCFNWEKLSEVLGGLSDLNSQKELYLTDAIKEIPDAYHLEVDEPQEVQGINNRDQLAECESFMQNKMRKYWMSRGVSFIDPKSCTLSEESIFGIDVIVEPQTHFRGKCVIGNNCLIGPGVQIKDSHIGNDVKIIHSVIDNADIENDISIGPFAHLRPKSYINNNVKIGNFVEIKNSNIGQGSKINHLSYIGDSFLGNKVNIGAGTITANYDGIKKSKTIIGNQSNTGANSVLVAPITIGANVTIGAGSTITKNIENNSLAVERSKLKIKAHWKNNH